MRSTCLDMPAGTASRERNVQCTSVAWGHVHWRGQGRLVTGTISTDSINMNAAERSIFSCASIHHKKVSTSYHWRVTDSFLAHFSSTQTQMKRWALTKHFTLEKNVWLCAKLVTSVWTHLYAHQTWHDLNRKENVKHLTLDFFINFYLDPDSLYPILPWLWLLLNATLHEAQNSTVIKSYNDKTPQRIT